MILINLLPHREAARKRQKEQFFTQLGFVRACWAASSVARCSPGTKGRSHPSKSATPFCRPRSPGWMPKSRTSPVCSEKLPRCGPGKPRWKILQSDRNIPVHLLDELVTQLPDGIYLQVDEAREPERAAERRGAVSGARVRSVAQPGQQQPMADAARVDRDRVVQRRRDRRATSDACSISPCAFRSNAPPPTLEPPPVRPAPPPRRARSDHRATHPWPKRPASTWTSKRVQEKLKSQFTGLDPERPIAMARFAAQPVVRRRVCGGHRRTCGLPG